MDNIVKAYTKVEERERLWREALETALHSPSPAARLQVMSVLSATVELFSALSRLESAEVMEEWLKRAHGEV
jgi:tRNA nucleotidyltransferase/poly(A) polymerase